MQLPEAFTQLTIHKNAFTARALSRTPLEELMILAQTLVSWRGKHPSDSSMP